MKPLAVNNFVSLSRDGFYDGLTFHRVLEGFMAQGGDPTGIGPEALDTDSRTKWTQNLIFDSRGILAMANSGPTQTEASSLSPSFPHHTLMETTRYLETH